MTLKLNHHGFLLSAFNYEQRNGETNITISYLQPHKDEEKTLQLQESNISSRPTAFVSHEIGSIITPNGKMHDYFHAIRIFDLKNGMVTVFYDIIDEHEELNAYFETNKDFIETEDGIRSVPLKLTF